MTGLSVFSLDATQRVSERGSLQGGSIDLDKKPPPLPLTCPCPTRQRKVPPLPLACHCPTRQRKARAQGRPPAAHLPPATPHGPDHIMSELPRSRFYHPSSVPAADEPGHNDDADNGGGGGGRDKLSTIKEAAAGVRGEVGQRVQMGRPQQE